MHLKHKVSFSFKKHIRNLLSHLTKKLGQALSFLKHLQGLGMSNHYMPIKFKNILLTLFLNLTFVWILSGFFIVPNHTEAIITRWRQYNRTLGAGIHWRIRFIEQIFKVNIGLQKFDVNNNLVFSQDAQLLSAALEIQYTIQDSSHFFLTIKDPIKYLRHIALSHLHEEVSHYKLADLLDKKSLYTIQANLQKKLQETIDLYKMGVHLLDISLPVIRFPADIKQAMEQTQETIQKAKYLESQAQLQAKQMEYETTLKIQTLYEKAYLQKQKAIAAAQTDTKHFLKLLPHYRKTPQLTMQRLYVQMLKKVSHKNHKLRLMKIKLDNTAENATSTPSKKPLSTTKKSTVSSYDK